MKIQQVLEAKYKKMEYKLTNNFNNIILKEMGNLQKRITKESALLR